MESAFLRGPGRSCQLSPGPPAAPGSPWPRGWAVAPASWLSSPAARVGAHFLAGTSDSGTVTWQGSHVTGSRALRIGGRQRGSDGVGGGERWGGEEERHQASSPLQDPSFGHRRPSNSPLSPPPHHHPPPQSVDSLGERTPPSDKLVERRAAGERHLTVPERCLAVPEEPGSPSTAVCAPRQPPGAPRAKLSAPGGAAGSRAPASLEQLQSGREHCAWRELPTRAAEAARLRGSPHPLPPPAGSC